MKNALITGALLSVAIGPVQAEAQRAAHSISGFVLNWDSRGPLPHALVSIDGTARVYTDSRGRFSIGGINADSVALQIRRIGYQPMTVDLDIQQDDTAIELIIALRAGAFRLRPIDIDINDARYATGHLNSFLQRRREGFGVFLIAADLERRHALRFTDLLYGRRGVRVRPCRGSRSTACITFPRQSPFGRSCGPTFYVDRMRFTDVDINNIVDPRNVLGVEIYADAFQAPMEYSSMGNCGGVIVIWTK